MASPAFSGIYNAVFRKNYVFLTVVFASAFGMEMAFDNTSNKVWDTINAGRQWKDIKHRYLEQEEDDD